MSSVAALGIKFPLPLTLFCPITDEEKKLSYIFIFTPCDASKGFMKVFKAFIKPFEAPQRRM